MAIHVLYRIAGDGRFVEEVPIDFIDGYPLEYWKMPDNHVLEAPPKYDTDVEVPVWDGSAWRIKKRAFFEPPSGLHEWDEKEERWYLPEQPEPEPSLLDGDVLRKALIALVDAVEDKTPISQEIKNIVAMEKAKALLPEKGLGEVKE